MLVKFALELDAIDENVRKQDLEFLMETWENFGILVHPTRKDIENAKEKSRTPKARQLWITTWTLVLKKNLSLRFQPLNEGSFDWEKIQSVDDLAQHSGKFEVALLEETRAEALGIGDGETKKFDEIEGVRFADYPLWRAEFQKASLPRIASLPYIARGSDRKDIWEKYFHQLAEISREIVIVDRYAMGEDNIQGVFWLLERLTEIAKASKIQINAGLKSEKEPHRGRREIVGDFRRKFRGKHIIPTEVRLFDDWDPMSKDAHDRHIRFDNHVIGIGRGAAETFRNEEIFGGTKVSVWILKGDEKDAIEKALDADPRRISHKFDLPID